MARHNSHRATGAARTPLSLGSVGKSACGLALVGAASFGAMSGAQAAPATAAPAPAAAPATLAATTPEVALPTITLTSTTTLRYSSQGSHVETLQSALNDAGANLAVDGKFGPRTESAVRAYQSANGLKVDGIVGPNTRAALNSGSSAEVSQASSSTSSSSNSAILAAARSQIGTDYQWGASSPGVGFDCSGFTSWVYDQVGINLSHSSLSQRYAGNVVSQSQAEPGDIVYWPGHVGIYAGNGKVIDAGRSPDAVTERSIWGNPIFIQVR